MELVTGLALLLTPLGVLMGLPQGVVGDAPLMNHFTGHLGHKGAVVCSVVGTTSRRRCGGCGAGYLEEGLVGANDGVVCVWGVRGRSVDDGWVSAV